MSGYKKTEVGVIPEVWEVKPLGSILNKGRLGGNYPNQLRETSNPLMKMGNLDRGHFDITKIEYIPSGVTPDPIDRLSYGDVLFNTRNTLDLVGKVAIWKDELPIAFYNSNLMRLEFNPSEICSSEYANYAFNSISGVTRLRALATGTTSVAAIYTKDLLQLPFIVPPRSEQRAIAAALSDVDAMIASLDRLIAKKRDMKQATMQELLTGKRRLPGFSGKWDMKTLGSMTTLLTNGFVGTVTNDYTDSDDGILYIQGYNVEANGFNLHGIKRVTTDFHSKHQKSCLQEGDLLTIQTGDIGVTTIVPTKFVGANCHALVISRFNKLHYEPRYYCQHFNSERGRVAFKEIETGSTMKHLNVGDMMKLPLPVPPLPEQTAIATILSDMDTDIATMEQKLDKTRMLKQGMMQELLTGRIRLV